MEITVFMDIALNPGPILQRQEQRNSNRSYYLNYGDANLHVHVSCKTTIKTYFKSDLFTVKMHYPCLLSKSVLSRLQTYDISQCTRSGGGKNRRIPVRITSRRSQYLHDLRQ